MIDFEKITFSNNYMFNAVMTRKELCRMCLERILNKRITDISIPDSEKWIGPDIDAKRSRYYQALMDIDMLEKGHDYQELTNSIVIFICTFDPYEMEKAYYDVRRVCKRTG